MSIAAALARVINYYEGTWLTASSTGYQLTVTANTAGASTDYPLSVSWTYDSTDFSAPSFPVDAPGSLTGGTSGASDPSAFAETYSIDPWGNQQESGSFNFQQPFSTNNRINASGYTYDAAGDLTHDALNNTYAYNGEGMMTASDGAQYVYDALDQRVEKTGGSNPTEVIYFNGQPVALLSGTAWTDLIWAGGREIATVPGTQTAQPTYRLLDHEGSLVMTTDNSGNVTGTNLLSPYGETISSNTGDSFQFAGLYQDTEYGGDAATFRNYSTEQLRWLRPDPYNGSYDMSNPQSFNRYVYAMNNPLNNVDPTGQQDENGDPFGSFMPSDAYIVDGMEVSEFEYSMLLSSGAVAEEIIGTLVPNVEPYYPTDNQACQEEILNAVNNQFGSNATSDNVVGQFNYSQGAPQDVGTLNLDISTNQPGSASFGRYPIHWWTYIIGIGPTLHVPSGSGGEDSPQTLPFSPNLYTGHIDSAYPYNPIGLVFHLLLDQTPLGGYQSCP
ncbi:MAG: RHS repeat-associated core domain-containing protein [Acidobacteriaceae bacterium]